MWVKEMVSRKQYLIKSEHKRRPICQIKKVMGFLFFMEEINIEHVLCGSI